MRSVAPLAKPSIMPPDSIRATKFSGELDGDLNICTWRGRSRRETTFMEKLISYQANELAEVCRLAMKVSNSRFLPRVRHYFLNRLSPAKENLTQ